MQKNSLKKALSTLLAVGLCFASFACTGCDLITDFMGGGDSSSVESSSEASHEHVWKDADCENPKTCETCGETEGEALAHNFDGGSSCSLCGNKIYLRNEDGVYFGSYPQSEVKDETTIAALNAQAGELPTVNTPGEWVDYGYYTGEVKKSTMWYTDQELDGENYRGVWFSAYRDRAYQQARGYLIQQIYWFKYEPLLWRVFLENDGVLTLYTSTAIDSQEIYHSMGSRYGGGKTIWANNYKESWIRAWLNAHFYNAAFSEAEQNSILTTTVDNSENSMEWHSNAWQSACENTQDKVYLLSYKQAVARSKEAKILQASAYARSQGCALNSEGYVYWWLRSPYHDYGSTRVVYPTGDVYNISSQSVYGVVPVIRISL